MVDFFSGLLGIEEDPLLAMLPPEQRAQLMARTRQQGIQNLGLQLLQAGGPTTTPGGIGSRLGGAIMGAQQSSQGMMDANLQRLLAARKLQQEQLQLQRQQQQREALQGAITPEGVNVQALQQSAMLSDDPLSALTRAAEAVPKLRRAGMLPGAAQMDNPFELFAQSPSESVRKAAQVYSQRYAQGGIEPDAADRIVGQLTNLEERTIGRQESTAARQEAQEANIALRRELAQQSAGQREQMLAMQREAQEDRRLTREMAQREKAEAKETKQINLSNQAKTVLGKVDEAINKVGGFTAGFGGLLANVPGTKARNLQADIDTIKANLGFQQLQAMRDASPTGGALGQVTERELGFLQSTVASLDQLQSPDELRRALNQIKIHYNNWLDTVNKGKAQPTQTGVRRYNPATGRVE